MNKGDIYLAEIPFLTGHEQSGFRPAIIFSEGVNNMIMAIPLTSKKKALNYKYCIEIKKSKENGLKENSYALIFRLRALDKRRFQTKTGTLEESHINQINKMVGELLILK